MEREEEGDWVKGIRERDPVHLWGVDMSFRVKLKKDGTRGRRVCETILAKEWSGWLSLFWFWEETWGRSHYPCHVWKPSLWFLKKNDLSLPGCILLSQYEWPVFTGYESIISQQTGSVLCGYGVPHNVVLVYISPTSSTPSFTQP